MSDTVIKQLIEKANKKLKEIGRIQSYENKTNLSFPFEEGSNRERVNLNIINDQREFIKILAFLISRKENYAEAAKELGIQSNFTWGGFSYDSWVHDIKNRVDVINLRKKKEELRQIQEQLDELMSPEMKREMKLEEIKKKLEE